MPGRGCDPAAGVAAKPAPGGAPAGGGVTCSAGWRSGAPADGTVAGPPPARRHAVARAPAGEGPSAAAMKLSISRFSQAPKQATLGLSAYFLG